MLVGKTVRDTGNTIEVAVLVNGIEQPLYRRPWDGKVFLASTPGDVYTLRVRNLTHGRLEVLNSVDGRNTLKDEPADARASYGMVVRGGSTFEFDGWRLNDHQADDFVFGNPTYSISAQATGTTSNVGVIGFAVYREKQLRRQPDLLGGNYRDGWDEPLGEPLGGLEAIYAPGTTRSLPSEDGLRGGAPMAVGGSVGTGKGATHESRVGRTDFDRTPGNPEKLIIGYDTEEVLRKAGIIAPPEPEAFPGIPSGYGRYESMPSA